MDIDNIRPDVLKKMVFIYNAVLDGWTVSKLKNNKIKCKKKIQEINTNLEDFVKSNCKLPRI